MIRLAMKLKLRYFIILIAVALCLLSGCAMQPALKPVRHPAATFKQVKAQFRHTHCWQMVGYMSVVRGQQVVNGNFTWQQRGQVYQIRLYGPLGIGEVKLSNHSGEVAYTAANGKQYRSNTAKQLMRAELGWSVPVAGLQYWIRGLPVFAVGLPTYRLNQYGTVATIDQQGWSIAYHDYRRLNGYPLPGDIRMHDGILQVNIRIDHFRQCTGQLS